ncbi:MAG: TlpA family protein disulfide reductase [Candidatus Thermoplasmatota archaeon]|nr:TlpA family protein disulfide reductase [Candidatus Thermoplasmatota archaeon]
MNPSTKTLFRTLLILNILIISLLLVGCVDTNQSTDGLNFQFTTLTGDTQELRDYYGTVLIVDLMGVNCPPCQRQIFELKKISENYSREQVNIISINVWVSQGETAQLTQELIQAYKDQVNIELDWTFGLDDTKATIGQKYAPEGVPTLFILDTRGNIYYTNVGYEEYSSLSEKINELV